MEVFGGSAFDSLGSVTKRRRSNTSRRPRPDSYAFLRSQERSPSSSTPPSDKNSEASSEENVGRGSGSHRKELNLNIPTSRFTFSRTGGETLAQKSRKDEQTYEESGIFNSNSSSKGSSSDIQRSREGVLSPTNWKNSGKVNLDSNRRKLAAGDRQNLKARTSGSVADGIGTKEDGSLHESKLRKVKVKVGGVTRTIHAKSSLESTTSCSASKPPCSLDAPRRQKLILEDNSDDDQATPDQANGLQGVPWKNGSAGNSKESLRGKISEESACLKQSDKSSEPIRKSKRVPKRRVLDGVFDEEEDEELRYLGRLKTAKVTAGLGGDHGEGDEQCKKQKVLKVFKSRMADTGYDPAGGENGSSWTSKEGKKKLRSERESEDIDYAEEEEEFGSDGGPDPKRKKPKRESLDPLAGGRMEVSLTTRQRALQSGKDGSSGTSTSLIEFPDGLPPAPARKQKEKLSEVEQQLKKAEAAERRRLQVEKAIKESQAEVIRKIRGQDSKRKKKEDKQRKQRDEYAREKAANAAVLAADMVRWVMGPYGTVVTFPLDVGLPSIFDSKPCSYPPPREKCAGPSCTNEYKYRDSKSKLPLCSLQCYRAIQQTSQPVSTC